MKRYIKTRRGTSDWFQENIPVIADKGLDSTDRHLHFENVLQRALQTLLPVEELRKGDSMTASNPPASPELTRRKVILQTHSACSELMKQKTKTSTLTALVTAECGKKKVSAPQKARYVVDTDDDDDDDDDGEEWIFSLYCFFFDMHELHIFLSVLWIICKTGQIDLATVAGRQTQRTI